MTDRALGASFRDPGGFVYRNEAELFRQVNESAAEDYRALMDSGLYEALREKELLVAHEEVAPPFEVDAGHFATLRPEAIPFIAYPYEWSFSQLKDAALLTLRLQRLALRHDMSLKDASAYNVQFLRGRPTMIDTLSFERYREGEPWVAYRQFCQHFLAPLALMARRDIRLNALLRSHIDGVPLDLAWSLLPVRRWLDRGLVAHLYLHARYQKRFEAQAGESGTEAPSARPLSRSALENMIEDLRQIIRRLSWKPSGTEWADYTSGDSYDEPSLAEKKEVVRDFIHAIGPTKVFDLGANTGTYSRIAAQTSECVVAFDVDPACVERNYLEVRSHRGEDEAGVLPLLLDLTNPSPSLGFAHTERESLVERGPADVVLALALIHHIAISNNVPLPRIAAFFASLAPELVIEFVPKEDPKVATLLATRADIFPDYTREGFEAAFAASYEIVETKPLSSSERVLYRMKRRA
ncbi:MAG: SAM-dependent methyltransferase [Myxococcota bacterium]|jgi:hypothetical protein|nr:SAM-dependent methyltransferase [Myxococcota bacterium]